MLKDLIHAGELPEEKIHLAVDSKKVPWHEENVTKDYVDCSMVRLGEDKVRGIFFDWKKDKTTATWVSLGKYLFHFSPELADEEEKAAENIVNAVNEWLLSRDLLGDLVMLRGGSTSTITGSAGGTIQNKLKNFLVANIEKLSRKKADSA